MRTQYGKVLKNHFQECIVSARRQSRISQRDMAYRLEMAPRTYADLEHGRTCCGAITLLIYMIYLCEEPLTFLEGIRLAFEACDQESA